MDAPPLTPLAAAVLLVPPPERALVIGCGEGEAALLLAREFPAARVRGVARSSEGVRRAQARVGLDPEGRLAFKQAGPRALPYPDDFFDLVAQVSDHASPAEIARVLSRGGHFIHARLGAPRPGDALRDRLLGRRLARRGFTPIARDDAGAGNFFIARLDCARRGKLGI